MKFYIYFVFTVYMYPFNCAADGRNAIMNYNQGKTEKKEIQLKNS